MVASILDFLVHKKYILTFLRDENFFSLDKSNGASKNSSFRTAFKNVLMTLVKSAPKQSFSQKLFYQLPKKFGVLGKTCFGFTF